MCRKTVIFGGSEKPVMSPGSNFRGDSMARYVAPITWVEKFVGWKVESDLYIGR